MTLTARQQHHIAILEEQLAAVQQQIDDLNAEAQQRTGKPSYGDIRTQLLVLLRRKQLLEDIESVRAGDFILVSKLARR